MELHVHIINLQKSSKKFRRTCQIRISSFTYGIVQNKRWSTVNQK